MINFMRYQEPSIAFLVKILLKFLKNSVFISAQKKLISNKFVKNVSRILTRKVAESQLLK